MMKGKGEESYHSCFSVKILSQHMPEENEKNSILADIRIREPSSRMRKIAYCLILKSGDPHVQLKCSITELTSP
jgi:hypothetical protein